MLCSLSFPSLLLLFHAALYEHPPRPAYAARVLQLQALGRPWRRQEARGDLSFVPNEARRVFASPVMPLLHSFSMPLPHLLLSSSIVPSCALSSLSCTARALPHGAQCCALRLLQYLRLGYPSAARGCHSFVYRPPVSVARARRAPHLVSLIVKQQAKRKGACLRSRCRHAEERALHCVRAEE